MFPRYFCQLIFCEFNILVKTNFVIKDYLTTSCSFTIKSNPLRIENTYMSLFETHSLIKKLMHILFCLTLVLLSGCVPSKPLEKVQPAAANLDERFKNQLKLKKVSHPKIQTVANQHAAVLKKLDPKRQEIFNYVLGEVEKRNMPAELALLPLMESSYNPAASARGRYIGLWQFGAPTARNFGLSTNKGNDARMDIQDSTKAALDYLEHLNRKFDGDWLLSIAAYNAGEGRILGLMKHNERQGKSTDFWSLNLPKVTSEYVPKMIGLSRILSDSKQLASNQNKTFATTTGLVRIKGNTEEIKQVINDANISPEAIAFYNPNLSKQDGSFDTHVVLPAAQAQTLHTLVKNNSDFDSLKFATLTPPNGQKLGALSSQNFQALTSSTIRYNNTAGTTPETQLADMKLVDAKITEATDPKVQVADMKVDDAPMTKKDIKLSAAPIKKKIKATPKKSQTTLSSKTKKPKIKTASRN